jgi:succinate dehydrogenase / fumarate reductase flavoprotein subunit
MAWLPFAKLPRRKFDVVIVGAGGSGMRASLQLAWPASTWPCCPRSSRPAHTVAAQGGIGASAGQHEPRTTGTTTSTTPSRVRTGWATRTRSSSCAARRPRSSTSSSTSACRSTATPTAPSTSARSAATPPTTARSPCSAPAPRPTAPATRCCTRCTSATCKARTNFFVEWMALDLIRDAEGDVLGVTALEMETGEVHILEAKTTLLATGGAGPHLRRQHQCLHQHRRRPGHGGARRHPAGGHGVLAVPPDRRGRRRRAADRRLPRRRRDPAQQATASASWSATRPR